MINAFVVGGCPQVARRRTRIFDVGCLSPRMSVKNVEYDRDGVADNTSSQCSPFTKTFASLCAPISAEHYLDINKGWDASPTAGLLRYQRVVSTLRTDTIIRREPNERTRYRITHSAARRVDVQREESLFVSKKEQTVVYCEHGVTIGFFWPFHREQGAESYCIK